VLRDARRGATRAPRREGRPFYSISVEDIPESLSVDFVFDIFRELARPPRSFRRLPFILAKETSFNNLQRVDDS